MSVCVSGEVVYVCGWHGLCECVFGVVVGGGGE